MLKKVVVCPAELGTIGTKMDEASREGRVFRTFVEGRQRFVFATTSRNFHLSFGTFDPSLQNEFAEKLRQLFIKENTRQIFLVVQGQGNKRGECGLITMAEDEAAVHFTVSSVGS